MPPSSRLNLTFVCYKNELWRFRLELMIPSNEAKRDKKSQQMSKIVIIIVKL